MSEQNIKTVSVCPNEVVGLNLRLAAPNNFAPQTSDWVLTDFDGGDAIDGISVVFPEETSSVSRNIERCVINIAFDPTMNQPGQGYYTRFIDDGLQFWTGKSDVYSDVDYSVSSDGSVLTLSVQCESAKSVEIMESSFVVLVKEIASGECKIVESPDPSIRVGRGEV
ncbi:hypothetical protein [Echinimonas agarilytica]|uniref:Uncharacterized protein n=1 Tax=Echinimonas agarilytica TaxID=1215918 RepID=A0AA41W423_9GAMM|nr:hypothetical protein [Echinimonas agarilytica]MCM2678439.1 hypothetical protein [Echinimonas agarilytica]